VGSGQDGGVTYPAHWEADVVLADGGTVSLRPIRPDDADRLREMHSRLSADTVYMRFFSLVRTLPARDVERFTNVDHDDRVAFVALLRDEMVGVVRYDRLPGTADAEVAVVVEDAHQGRGLGPLMLEHLAAAGEERGIERFVANVLPGNRRMLEVFRSAGFEIERHLADGVVELAYPIRRTAATVSVSRAREHRAEARSVARLLAPQAVAVVGASREPGTAGHEVFRSLLAFGFEGPVYPVNPAASHVAGVRAYADVRDVPDDVDLAVIAVPAPQVLDVVRACVEKRVRGLVVVSGGFADAGEEGRTRLAEVVRTARDGGIRLIGPNAMGVVNTDPAVSLHATFAAGHAGVGRVGIFSQSGALAGTVLQAVERRGLGLSTFVSIGDRADVSGNDLLQYWQEDERTDVVGLHLQGFGNPRKFARIPGR
jgi:succinyl-CoA synthetase alpha subunit/RimJ/RimL family protein N-acetyltransferase